MPEGLSSEDNQKAEDLFTAHEKAVGKIEDSKREHEAYRGSGMPLEFHAIRRIEENEDKRDASLWRGEKHKDELLPEYKEQGKIDAAAQEPPIHIDYDENTDTSSEQ